MAVTIDRIVAAQILGVHPDTVSERLRTDAALRACLVTRGGHGKRQSFATSKLVEYALATRNPRALAEVMLDRLEDGTADWAPAKASR